jgi:glycosyltransferase involved in cell wall biosynthesis
MKRAGVILWAPAFCRFGGGITAFGRELAQAVSSCGHEVALWGKEDQSGRWNGLTLHGTGLFPNVFRTAAFALGVVAHAAIVRPRLVVCTHLNFGPAAYLLKRLAGVPYVLVAHGIEAHEGLSRSRRKALRGADSVWAVSQWTRGRVMALGVREDRIRVVPNTVDGERFVISERRVDLQKQFGLARSDRVILTVARLDAREGYKGYDTVLRALPTVLSTVGPVRYLIAGKGSDLSRLQRLVAELGLSEAVSFCGFVSDTDLPDLYRLADVFAMPSRGEGFGIVFLEAMASGVPVLGGDSDGTVDALANGELGLLVNPEDASQVADGLIQLLNKQGPDFWFQPEKLRANCLAKHGHISFENRVSAALADLGISDCT